MKSKIMLTTLATIGLLAMTTIFGYSQSNTAKQDTTGGNAEFHMPQSMGSTVNSEVNESGGFLSPNGLSFYFSGQRAGGLGQGDIWVSQRQTLSSAWGAPQNLGAPINTDSTENRAKLSLDGKTMFFNSNREGGAQDIYMSTRIDANDDFGWTMPVNLGANINTPFTEVGAALFEDQVTEIAILYFASDRDGGKGDLDIYQSRRNPDGTFNPAVNVTILNTVARDSMPFPSRDGLEIYVVSDNGGLGMLDIWVAARVGQFSRWRRPVNVSSVNSEFDELDPSLSYDGSTLYFNSQREGGFGIGDLYSATRLCTSSK